MAFSIFSAIFTFFLTVPVKFASYSISFSVSEHSLRIRFCVSSGSLQILHVLLL